MVVGGGGGGGSEEADVVAAHVVTGRHTGGCPGMPPLQAVVTIGAAQEALVNFGRGGMVVRAVEVGANVVEVDADMVLVTSVVDSSASRAISK